MPAMLFAGARWHVRIKAGKRSQFMLSGNRGGNFCRMRRMLRNGRGIEPAGKKMISRRKVALIRACQRGVGNYSCGMHRTAIA